MKTATLTETKNNLSALVDQVRNGESILILDRGRPVARLESAVTPDEDADGRVARLERQGLVRRASTKSAGKILSQAPPKSKPGSSILTALLADRHSSR